MKTTFTYTNNNPKTIWNKLATKLGRGPTYVEAKAEVKRILEENSITMAEKGRLPHQRKR